MANVPPRTLYRWMTEPDFERWRGIVINIGETGALASCQRSLCKGVLTETVVIDGSADGITEQEIQQFIDGFPVAGATDYDMRLIRAAGPGTGQMSAGSRK